MQKTGICSDRETGQLNSEVKKGNINENTGALFMEAISELCTLALPSVNDLDNANYKIENVIDVIAPVRVSSSSDKQKATWRNAKSVMIQKRKCRKAEQMAKKNILDIFKEKINIYNV